MQLSIIIPVFNERNTVAKVLERLSNSGCNDCEWMVVDDGSTDGTTEVLKQCVPASAKLLLKSKNEGKSAAVRNALELATGDWVIVQDADLEYDPADIPKLLKKGIECDGMNVAVYGRRPSCWNRPSRWLFASGVLFIDLALLFVYRRWVRDHATCYKLVPRKWLNAFELEASGFEGCVEITAKLMRSGIPIHQIPISYSPRRMDEGKKLTAAYGLTALRAVWKYRNWKLAKPEALAGNDTNDHCSAEAACALGSGKSTAPSPHFNKDVPIANAKTRQGWIRSSVLLVGALTVAFGIYSILSFPNYSNAFVRSNGSIDRTKAFDLRKTNQRARSDPVPIGLSPWQVHDAFPETRDLWGAMQMRPHPIDHDKWFVLTFKGKLFELQRSDTGLSTRVVIDLSSEELEWAYSFALHPDFGSDPAHNVVFIFYLTDRETTPLYYRVSAFTVRNDGPAELIDERLLIEQQIEHKEHLGGALDFDKDGFLLIAVGDNGEWNDKSENSQRIDRSLFSGILRIDVEKRGGKISRPISRQPLKGRTGGYFIPRDNPFVSQWHVLGEFWAVGFRNPFRMSYDSKSGFAWVGEVGQNRIEQIERVSRGSNHQWSFQEGTELFQLSYLKGVAPKKLLGTLADPFHQYLHEDQNYCVVGGLVYRGDRYPELVGRYICGDNQSGRVWSIDVDNTNDKQLILQLPAGKENASLTSICSDHDGRIYFTHFASGGDGVSVHELIKIEPVQMPDALSQTGTFRNVEELDIAEGFVFYDVNSPLWSDGLNKRRWLKIPGGKQIDNSDVENPNWTFPVGTVFVKHFEHPTELDSNSRPRKIETRVLEMDVNGRIFGATYVWNESGTDAIISLERSEVNLHADNTTGKVFNNGTSQQVYRLPGFRDCLVCHNHNYQVLGINAAQLNRSASLGSDENQLAEWSRRGLFLNPYSEERLREMPRLVDLHDDSQSIEMRARSYLHSNCSFCHYPEGTQRTHFDARITTSLAAAKMIAEKSETGYFEVDGRKSDWVIKPGFPEESAAFRRLRTSDRERSMPYLGKSIVDQDAVDVFQKRIASLPKDQSRN